MSESQADLTAIMALSQASKILQRLSMSGGAAQLSSNDITLVTALGVYAIGRTLADKSSS
jgi:hypothetical protein